MSCLGLRSVKSGIRICPLSDEVDNYKSDCDEYDSQLVSLQPLNKMLACETSQLEHEQLQHVLLRQGIDVPVHPWIHGMVSSGISLANPSPFGGGELGHTVVTRICYPVMPSKEINEENSSEEIFGSVRGYVYDNKFGSQMVYTECLLFILSIYTLNVVYTRMAMFCRSLVQYKMIYFCAGSLQRF